MAPVERPDADENWCTCKNDPEKGTYVTDGAIDENDGACPVDDECKTTEAHMHCDECGGITSVG